MVKFDFDYAIFASIADVINYNDDFVDLHKTLHD